ncbi:unnamed protein product, partial [Mesorhabditis belari]|uniref:JmjC domain-containing protein n=1 Tax=Mesorhabditis belari TaxID=2138241 RepID=A0AAF3FP49_9BILA
MMNTGCEGSSTSNYDPVTKIHRRSTRRVVEAKRKARPELNNYGWNTLGFATSFDLPPITDTIIRLNGSEICLEEFRENYEKPRIPVIITGLTSNWAAHEKWTPERLLKKYRNQKFKCGEDDDGYSVKIKMKYYYDYMRTNDDDSPLYVFDSSFGERHKTKKLLEDYEIPKFWEDDLFRYAEMKKRPPHRWIVFGPARSGTAIHIDPLGTSAWNALIHGHKRWVLIPPDAPKALVKPMKHEAGKHPDEAVTCLLFLGVRSSSWPKEYPIIECRQAPGKLCFVPAGWWHVVINESVTVAITQNLCSIANLHIVWPKTVRGRPKFSKHWFKRIKSERPELISIMEASEATPQDENSSSDSSSSSSSSDDSDSDSGNDDGVEKRMQVQRKRRHSQTISENKVACASKLGRSPERKQ